VSLRRQPVAPHSLAGELASFSTRFEWRRWWQREDFLLRLLDFVVAGNHVDCLPLPKNDNMGYSNYS